MPLPAPASSLSLDAQAGLPASVFGAADPSNPALEWLEADALGGFASGTVGLVRTRRYHALLLAAARPPSQRTVLVNGVEAWLEKDCRSDQRAEHRSGAQRGGRRLALSTQCYANAVYDPDGRARLRGFCFSPWPSWRFACEDAGEINFEIVAARAAGDTVLRWWATEPAQCDGWQLHVRPLLSVRDFHALHHENDAFDFSAEGDEARVSWKPYRDRPAVSALSNGRYCHAPDWYRQFWYAAEAERGLDCTEDLASPGIFSFALAQRAAVLVLRAGDSRQVAVDAYADAVRAEERRARGAVRAAPSAAADQYVVERGLGHTLIAGYPWFGDWGRDTFIAMRGLLIARGRLDVAHATLEAWARTVSEGMLPNRFPDDDGAPEYNSVDASLWYVVAYHDYAEAARPHARLRAPIERAIEAILDGYRSGTRYGIHEAEDGLLAAGQHGMQLTWMDAKVDDQVVTPRIGKPVEIQALWYNALRIAARFAPRFAPVAERARTAFALRFENTAPSDRDAVLADVIDCDHVAGRIDTSIRPNQILAVGGLPFPLLEGAVAKAVLDQVERLLLTPLGLRTLAPAAPGYAGRYLGSPLMRDRAYHQGTAWPWLLGPFVDAWLRVHGNHAATRATARARFLAPLRAHLREAGLGHVSEIADGDWPHTPRGAPFQAWSLGEMLRIEQWLDDRTQRDTAAGTGAGR